MRRDRLLARLEITNDRRDDRRDDRCDGIPPVYLILHMHTLNVHIFYCKNTAVFEDLA